MGVIMNVNQRLEYALIYTLYVKDKGIHRAVVFSRG